MDKQLQNNNMSEKDLKIKREEAKKRTSDIAAAAVDEAKEIIDEAAAEETVWQLQSADGKKAKEVMTDTCVKACIQVKADLTVNQSSDKALTLEQLTEDIIQSGITYLAKVNAVANMIDEKIQNGTDLTQLEHDLLGTGEAEKVTFGQITKVMTGITQFYKHIMPKSATAKAPRKVNNLRRALM